MNLYYLDTSAIVKYYHTEPGSGWIRQLIDARDPEDARRFYIAEITIAEGAAAFAILVRTHRVRTALRDAMYQDFLEDVLAEYQTIHVRREEIDRAAELTQQHDLKGYDAVQLAVALYVNDLLKTNHLSLTFVAADETLLQAARAEGMATENPFDHSDLDTPR
jgi:predicted nucleic acid-binding protein